MFLPLLLLATLAMLVEGWLANPRRAKSQDAAQSKASPEIAPTEQSDDARDAPGPEVLVSGGAG